MKLTAPTIEAEQEMLQAISAMIKRYANENRTYLVNTTITEYMKLRKQLTEEDNERT